MPHPRVYEDGRSDDEASATSFSFAEGVQVSNPSPTTEYYANFASENGTPQEDAARYEPPAPLFSTASGSHTAAPANDIRVDPQRRSTTVSSLRTSASSNMASGSTQVVGHNYYSTTVPTPPTRVPVTTNEALMETVNENASHRSTTSHPSNREPSHLTASSNNDTKNDPTDSTVPEGGDLDEEAAQAGAPRAIMGSSTTGESMCRKKSLFLWIAALVLLAGGAVGVVFGVTDFGSEESKADPTLHQVDDPLHGDVDSRFGFSVSINNDGSRVAVADLGSVSVYEHGQDKWVKMGNKIEAPANTTTATGLLEGGTVLIRAPVIVKMSANGEAIAVGWSSYEANRGLVQVFRYNEDAKEWEPHGDPLIGSDSGYYYGASLDLSEDGSVLAVGAPGKGGLVSVHTFNTGEWRDLGRQVLKEGIRGLTITSVSLARNGRTLAFGGVAGTSETVARMLKFDIDTGDWEELGNGLHSTQNGTAYNVDLSGDGTTVAISNYYYLASNPGENNDALDVRAYRWSEEYGFWRQMGETLHSHAPGAKSGYFISLSNDGRTMVMGDPGRIGESGGGGNTGHSHVYIFDGEEWFQLGPNILGEAAGDHFGYDVVVSGDGKRFAASAPFSRALGTEYPHGRVLVFDIPEV